MNNSTTNSSDAIAQQRDDFIDRFLGFASGTFSMFSIYIGDRLGLYRALSQNGGSTPKELAAKTGTHARYIREWLEQQTVAGVLKVENPDDPATQRRFYLPEAAREVLADPESIEFMAGTVQCVVGAAGPLDHIVDAYRTGAGVPFEAYGLSLIHI